MFAPGILLGREHPMFFGGGEAIAFWGIGGRWRSEIQKRSPQCPNAAKLNLTMRLHRKRRMASKASRHLAEKLGGTK